MPWSAQPPSSSPPPDNLWGPLLALPGGPFLQERLQYLGRRYRIEEVPLAGPGQARRSELLLGSEAAEPLILEMHGQVDVASKPLGEGPCLGRLGPLRPVHVQRQAHHDGSNALGLDNVGDPGQYVRSAVQHAQRRRDGLLCVADGQPYSPAPMVYCQVSHLKAMRRRPLRFYRNSLRWCDSIEARSSLSRSV